MERRLAAILAADVVAYTALMERDENDTHARLKERRKTLLEPTIRAHRGNIFKLTGDGALVDFPSIVAAVHCAVAIQRLNEHENVDLPEAARIRLRIGINIGDVILDENDIYGAGVNVAARIESLAPPGGICLTGAAYQQVQGRLGITFRHTGKKQLRNIKEPVDIYEVVDAREEGVLAWTRPALPPGLDRPSLAILPFRNVGEDTTERYFSDGVTRDLITELSRFRSLFVISAESSFQYRHEPGNRVGEELGVRYLVNGSVQHTGGKLRVTASLSDAQSGIQFWSDRYSENDDDPGAVQDWMVRNIASRLQKRLDDAEMSQIKRKPPASLKSYDLWLRATCLHESSNADAYVEADRLYRQAIEMDPGFARAYASLAELSYMESVLSTWGLEDKDDCAEAERLAETALSLDNQDANGHAIMGWVQMVRHNFVKAARSWDIAISLNPNDADIRMWHATSLAFMGQPEAGIEEAHLAMQLNPLHPDWYLSDYAIVLFFCRRFEEMQSIYDVIPELFPHTPGWRAAAYAHQGDAARAREKAQQFAANIAAIWAGAKPAQPQDYGAWFRRCIPLMQPAEMKIMDDGLRLCGLLP